MIGVGRTSEVTRDEVKFTKFIIRLRNKFSQIFDNALKIQLVLKGICTADEWDDFKEDIYYNYKKDNNFTELRDAELLRERLGLLQTVDPYIGRYYSMAWVQKNVLQMDEETIKKMKKEIDKEEEQGIGGPTLPPEMQQQQQADAEANPPVDNTQDEAANESLTPQLDSDVERFSALLNKR